MSDGGQDDINSGDPAPNETSVYGAVQRGGGEPEATSAYGAAAPPRWSAPGQAGSPEPTAAQPPDSSQARYTKPQFEPQPTPDSPPTQAYPLVGAPAPVAPPPVAAPSGYGAPQHAPGSASAIGPKRWNLWAGVAIAVSVTAIGNGWRLSKVVGNVFDFPFRQQFGLVLESSHLVLGVLTLVALAAKKRTPAAALTFLLGGSLLATVTYSWYLQMDQIFDGFDVDFFLEQVAPNSLGTLLLSVATIASAFLLRVDRVQRY